MAILNSRSELPKQQANVSAHTCCTNLSCVEVLFDKDMQLVYVSEQYNPIEQVPMIDPDNSTVSFKQFQGLPKHVTGPNPGLNDVIYKDQIPANTLEKNYSREKKVLEGDTESSGGCSSCAEKAKQKKAGMLKRLAKGVPGLLKSELGIDQASLEVVDKRKSICLNCPEGIYNFGVCDEERGGCGCFLASKVTIEGESCPKGHW